MSEVHIIDKEVELTLRFHVVYEPYVPAKIFGPPENCYPAEGGTAGAFKVEWIDKAGKARTIELPNELLSSIEETLYEEISNDY